MLPRVLVGVLDLEIVQCGECLCVPGVLTPLFFLTVPQVSVFEQGASAGGVLLCVVCSKFSAGVMTSYGADRSQFVFFYLSCVGGAFCVSCRCRSSRCAATS